MRTKRCRTATAADASVDGESMEVADVEIEDCNEVLEEKTRKAVEKLKTAVTLKYVNSFSNVM